MQSQKSDQYLDELRIVHQLGSAYQPDLKLAQDQQGNLVAIKIYKPQTTLLQQLQVMQQLQHQNIIRLISVRQHAVYRCGETHSTCLAMVVEYAGGGQLLDYVAESGPFPEKVARTYFHQMINALHYMHERGITHTDIKPQNILLSDDYVLKIADFGFNCLLGGRDGEGYLAPEIGGKEYDGRAVDMFAAAVILFIIFAGSPPFEKATGNDPYYKLIKERRYDLFWQAHGRRRSSGFFPASFRDLFQRMTAFNPADRPAIRQIATHSWVNSSICTQAEMLEELSDRKARLEEMVGDRRREQERERGAHVEAIRSQGYCCRCRVEQSSHHFAQIYIKQKLKPRQIESGVVEGAIIIEAELQYLVSRLKIFLSHHRIKLQDEDEQEREIALENEEEGELESKQIQDKGSYIRVTYLTRFTLQDQTYQQEVVVDIQLTRATTKQIAVLLVPVRGQQWYFRKIVADLRTKCL